jgi:DNA-directed RNA polymerase specialized sigma24 family protein
MSKADADELLLRRAHAGDSAAFVSFATRWWAPVHRIALNMLGSAPEATQAAERIVLLLVRFPGAVGVPLGVSVLAAAIDVTLLQLRSARRAALEPLDGGWPGLDARGLLVSDGDWSDQVDRLIQRPGIAETIRELLQRIDDLDRAAFVLREIEGLPSEAAAAILCMPKEEVRARTHRAITALTFLLGQMLRSAEEQRGRAAQ